MQRTWILVLLIAGILVVPVVSRAHEGHTHKVLGTVTSVQDNHAEIKTTAGKALTIMLDEKTAITRGKVKFDATALKAGERVSVEYVQEKKMNVAKTIKLGQAPAAAKK
jgi:hypothetical protein